MKRHPVCELCFLTLSALSLQAQPSIHEPARVEVSIRQTAEHAAPIGVNEFGDPGGTKFSSGNLIPGAGFEPISIRRRFRVTNSGMENGRPWAELDMGGVTYYDLVTSGYLSGADYRLYRLVNSQGQPLPPQGGYLDLAQADAYAHVHSGVVPPEGTPGLPDGGWVEGASSDRVYLEQGGPQLHLGDYLHFSKRILQGDPDWSHSRVYTGTVGETWRDHWSSGLSITRVAHPGSVPAGMRFAGESCLSVTAPAAGGATISGPYIFFPERDDGEAEWYSVLEPGQTYRYEAWMRQDGLGDGGSVTLSFISQYEGIGQSFSVDGEWRLHAFTFTAPAAPTSGWHGAAAVHFTGPGTLYIDNIRLFRMDDPAQADDLFVPSPLVFDELMASQPEQGEKGMLRSMYVLLNQSTMASLLTPYADDRIVYDWYQAVQASSNMTLPALLNYAFLTGDSPSNRMKPWLNMSSNMTEAEWRMLIEYLAAPIDPEDPADVAAKPWAFLRYQVRGVSTPWTDEFSRIYIEFANETWHNGAVELEWFGWGPGYGVHQGGLEFGLFAHYISDMLATQSPWFEPARQAGSLSLVMGSNYGDYAEIGVPEAPRISGIGHTTYVGPRWETGDSPNTVFDDHGVQATLLGYIADTGPNYFETFRWNREGLLEQGITTELLGYEGGPSGYSLPGTAPADQVEVGEQYGKSQAMAVAALDAWLGSNQYGFADQAFLTFAQGSYWSSHTPIVHGFRRHIPWLALMMRNRYASGQLIDARVVSGPEIDWAGSSRSLLGTYAFRNGSQLMVFLLSRKLDGQHDGQDFGDGSIEVTLSLPADPVGNATLYHLSGDPRTSNRGAQNVSIQQQPVSLSRESILTLPPGAIHLYVINTNLPAAPQPPNTVSSVDVSHQAGSSSVSWPALGGASGYRVYRSLSPRFRHDQVESIFDVTTNSFEDYDAVGGSTFYYRVAGLNSWGEGLWSPLAVGGSNPFTPPYPAPLLLAAGVGDERLLLQWEPVAGATGYRLGVRTGSGAYTWYDLGHTTEHLLTGLTNGVPIGWTVQSYGPEGRGNIAPESIAIPRAADLLGTLAAWEFDGMTSFEPSVQADRRLLPVQVTPLMRGPGFIAGTYEPPPNTYHPLPNMFGFWPHANHNNFSAIPSGNPDSYAPGGPGTLQMAIDRDMYLGFTVTPLPGYGLNLESIDTGIFDPYYGTPDPPYSVDPALNAELLFRVGSGPWTSLPGGPQTIASAFSGPLNNTAQNHLAFDLSGVSELQDLQEAVEFRIYVYSTQDEHRYCRAALQRESGEDLILSGSYVSHLAGIELWRTLRFTPSEIAAGHADDLFDFDKDCLANLLEFILGTDPRIPNCGIIRLTSPSGGTTHEFHFTRAADIGSEILTIQRSQNLQLFEDVCRFQAGAWSYLIPGVQIQETGTDPIDVILTLPARDIDFVRMRAN